MRQTGDVLITPEHLRQTYLNSVVTIEIKGEWISAEHAIERLSQPIFVLTASNPDQKVLTDVENEARNRDLRDCLLRDGFEVHPAQCASPDAAWRVEGWAVTGLTLKVARRIGRSWGQDAIFGLRDRHLRVLGCFSSWVRLRPLISEDRPGTQLTNFTTAAVTALGVTVSASIVRAEWSGWSHDGDLFLPCPQCGKSLHFFGADLISKAGVPYRSTIFVCPVEPTAYLPNEVPKTYLAAARTRRAYLISSLDADALGDNERRYWAYVIELGDKLERPPGAMNCWVYVGQSSHTPEERFAQHLAGYKASKWVKNFGERLRADLYLDQPVLRTQAEALSYEAWLAAHLEAQGHPVKGGH